jgi:hypothetical protein
MKKEIPNQSIFHLFPHRSIMIENRRYAFDMINRTSDKMTSDSSSNQKSDTTTNNPSQISRLTKFCYKKICTTCIPETIRIDQEKNEQINIDSLYAFDPLQIEVGD